MALTPNVLGPIQISFTIRQSSMYNVEDGTTITSPKIGATQTNHVPYNKDDAAQNNMNVQDNLA